MLVLTRKRGQTIVIGDTRVTVVTIGREKTRLSISAPRHIPVHRQELREAMRREHPCTTEPTSDTPTIVLPKEEGESLPRGDNRPVHLLLWRRRDETILIGEDVVLTVVDIQHDVRGDKVRLGITAPREIPVHRQEVFEAILRGKQQSAPRADLSGTNEPGEADS